MRLILGSFSECFLVANSPRKVSPGAPILLNQSCWTESVSFLQFTGNFKSEKQSLKMPFFQWKPHRWRYPLSRLVGFFKIWKIRQRVWNSAFECWTKRSFWRPLSKIYCCIRRKFYNENDLKNYTFRSSQIAKPWASEWWLSKRHRQWSGSWVNCRG